MLIFQISYDHNVYVYIYIQGVSKGSLQNFRGDSRHEDSLNVGHPLGDYFLQNGVQLWCPHFLIVGVSGRKVAVPPLGKVTSPHTQKLYFFLLLML